MDWSNKKLVLEAVKQNGSSLECSSRELQNDKEVVLEAVKQDGSSLHYSSKELQNDKEISQLTAPLLQPGQAAYSKGKITIHRFQSNILGKFYDLNVVL
jgi:hypothetical protein